jgi:hypothetical protein
MDKNQFALTPPRGWNSYDYYDTTVTESEIRANAEYMAQHLKPYGYEYVVVDIQWYAQDAGTQRDRYQYIPFGPRVMDEYGRFLPCPIRFPSSRDGAGFQPLADYIHSLGLKFGIHVMRGIPREAAHKHLPVLGTHVTADRIADPNSICLWNPDMYGLRDCPESQAYYNSILDLYAQWGVDFIKVDDICYSRLFPSDPYLGRHEVEMLHNAIVHCGRPIVLSLSPGPAILEEAAHYSRYANMWRITDDFWDTWPLLRKMFDYCEKWQYVVSPGCWPDCDMLPVGKVGKGFCDERMTNFTRDEQQTMMALWCLFRSPLMVGADLPQLDAWTLELLTNEKLLALQSGNARPRQVIHDQRHAVWLTDDPDTGMLAVAVFNFRDEISTITTCIEDWNRVSRVCVSAGDQILPCILGGADVQLKGGACSITVNAHGSVVFGVCETSK